MKIGEKVRFLSEVGGGIVTGFQGKDTALVQDAEGFDIPMPIGQLVVIDTDDYNIAKVNTRTSPKGSAQPQKPTANPQEDTDDDRPVTFVAKPVERKGGNTLNIYLGFVPTDIKEISTTSIRAYLVNDSNYYLSFTYLSAENAAWHPRFQGTVEPNKKLLLEEFELQDLVNMEHLCIQAIAYKTDRPFALKPALSCEVRLDTVKFYKLHTFQPSPFFSAPALVYPLVRDDRPR